jgi:hypothetical protein
MIPTSLLLFTTYSQGNKPIPMDQGSWSLWLCTTGSSVWVTWSISA